MCEILYSSSLVGNVDKNALVRMSRAMVKSGVRNPDGWGLLVPRGQSWKGQSRFTNGCKNYILDTESPIVIGHTRLATGNKDLVGTDYSHPFYLDGYSLVHNGIFNGDLVNQQEVDSFSFLKRIVASTETTTIGKIRDAAEQFTGYCSCFLSDPEGRLFYFKQGASFTFALTRRLIVGASTKETMHRMLTYKQAGFFDTRIEAIEQEPEDQIIYLLTQDKIQRIAEFKLKENPVVYCRGFRGQFVGSGHSDSDSFPARYDENLKRFLTPFELETEMKREREELEKQPLVARKPKGKKKEQPPGGDFGLGVYSML